MFHIWEELFGLDARGLIDWSSRPWSPLYLRLLLMYQVPGSAAGDGAGCTLQAKFKFYIFWKAHAFLEVTVKNNKKKSG